MKVRIEGTLLRTVIGAVETLVNEVNIVFDKEGIHMKSMDVANVALVVATILPQGCVEYDVGENGAKMGMNLKNFNTILKRARADDMVRLEESEDKGRLVIGLGENRRFDLPILELEKSGVQKVPELTFASKITMPRKMFSESIEDMKIAAESTMFAVTEKKFKMRAEGELSIAEVEHQHDGEAIKIVSKKDEKNEVKEVKGKYAIEYLQKMVGNLADDVTIEMSNDRPLRLTYRKADKFRLSYTLAPRVNND